MRQSDERKYYFGASHVFIQYGEHVVLYQVSMKSQRL